jgi:hypothetical protein
MSNLNPSTSKSKTKRKKNQGQALVTYACKSSYLRDKRVAVQTQPGKIVRLHLQNNQNKKTGDIA